MLSIMSKEDGKALIKPCMVIGMLLSSTSEWILAFVGMPVCSGKGAFVCFGNSLALWFLC